MEFMSTCEYGQFSLAIIDPPYTDSFNSDMWGKDKGKIKQHRKNTHLLTGQKPDHSFFTELQRISENQIIWGGNYFTDCLRVSRCWQVWDKNQTGQNFSDFEMAWSSFDEVSRLFRFTWNGMLQENMKDKEVRIHPSQKPVQLYKWLLKNYAKKGDKILDTHMGSQSSRIACYEGGFDYWGTEIDNDCFRDGCERFENYKLQLRLF